MYTIVQTLITLPSTAFLVTDDAQLAQLATERGAITPLSELVRMLTPVALPTTISDKHLNTDVAETEKQGEEEEEPEGVSRLREVHYPYFLFCHLNTEPFTSLRHL